MRASYGSARCGTRRRPWLKLGTGLVALYVISPIDLIPDAIPFFGQLDDIVVASLAIRWMLKRLPPEIAQASAARR